MECCTHTFIKKNCLCHNCSGDNCDYSKQKTITNYKIEITFSTDKDLSEDQSMQLINALLLQIEEPVDYDQNDEDYETSQINYKMEEVK